MAEDTKTAKTEATGMTRREFIDVMAKTLVVGAAFTAVGFTAGCSSGSSDSPYGLNLHPYGSSNPYSIFI